MEIEGFMDNKEIDRKKLEKLYFHLDGADNHIYRAKELISEILEE